jgi:hypothetical protein
MNTRAALALGPVNAHRMASDNTKREERFQ